MSAVDLGFEPRSGHTKDYKISLCCFSAKYKALMIKSKDWLARNENNVSGATCLTCLPADRLLQWASTINKKSACWSRTKPTIIIIISLRFNLFSPWYNWKMTRLVLNNNHSLTSFTLKSFVICHMHAHLISLRRDVGNDNALQRTSSQRSLKCDLVSGNLSDSSPPGHWNFIVQIQLLGFTMFCWVTKIVTLRSPAGNCSKNGKF